MLGNLYKKSLKNGYNLKELSVQSVINFQLRDGIFDTVFILKTFKRLVSIVSFFLQCCTAKFLRGITRLNNGRFP